MTTVNPTSECGSIYSNRTTHAHSTSKRRNNSIWTNINGRIENTRQGDVGDCWLLSTLNSLRETDWGKRAIKNSIKSDGKGGAVITFKLNGGKNTKQYHITLAQIRNARANGQCSTGDDDVAALELAFKRHFGDIEGGGREGKVIELICGKVAAHRVDGSDFDRIIKEIEKNPNKYVVTLGVLTDSKHLMGEHAYQVKKVVTDRLGKKWLYVVNPWDASKTIKVSAKEAKDSMLNMTVLESTQKGSKNLETGFERLGKNIDKMRVGSKLRENIFEAIMKKDDTALAKSLRTVNKDNIMSLFSDKGDIELIVSSLDRYKCGLGKGKEKKALILPLVNALCAKAIACGVDKKAVRTAMNACMKELDAMFYTNEKTIIKALQNLYTQISVKEN